MQLVVIIYLFSCGTFNITGIAVTGALSAVHRMMLDASRSKPVPSGGFHGQGDPQVVDGLCQGKFHLQMDDI